MDLNSIIYRASSVYPEEALLEEWDSEFECPSNPDSGDTLAKFIVHELEETFDETATDAEQLATAIKVMQRAADEVQAVADALSVMATERMAA